MSYLTNEEIFAITAKNFSDIDFANAIIAANNAKVLKDLKPRLINGYDAENKKLEDACYSADQVSVLIQQRDSLMSQRDRWKEWKDAASVTVELLKNDRDAFKAKIIESLKAFADAKYISALKQCEQDACLGWEHKVQNGKYGDSEHQAHANASKDFGAHFGIYEALKHLLKASS